MLNNTDEEGNGKPSHKVIFLEGKTESPVSNLEIEYAQ